MVSLKELRKASSAELSALGNDSPLADTDYLLMYLLGFSREQLIFGDNILSEEQHKLFSDAFKRLKSGEPVQYIAGRCEFMSLEFEVNPSTLIPRADTEVLVETVISLCKKHKLTNIFEIGTGSGCIAISLAKFLPNTKVTSVDISADALSTAERNAKTLGVSERCRFEKIDIMKEIPSFENLPDIIVSNPPYIPKKDLDALDLKVRGFEPLTALDGGDDGLDFYRRIALDLPLKPNGFLAFEVGINQAEQVVDIMKNRFCDISIIPDLNGIQRVVIGCFEQYL